MANQPPEGPPRKITANRGDFENSDLHEALFASRWLAWLGGVTLALGGGFLVKYSIEQGYLNPLARVTLSGFFGLVLIVLGEVLRRRPIARAVAVPGEQTIPPALTAAGLLTCYAAAFGAYALYGLVSPVPAFALLATISSVAVLLSLVHGPFIGVLGLAGAYAVPLIVGTREPSALALFSYLGFVNLAALSIARLRDWWWLGWVVLLIGGLWALLFMRQGGSAGPDVMIVAAYSLWFGALFAVLAGTSSAASEDRGDGSNPVHILAVLGSAAGALLLLKLVIEDGFASLTLFSVSIMILLYTLLAAAFMRLAPLAVTAGGFVLVLLLKWPSENAAVSTSFEVLNQIFALLYPDRNGFVPFAVASAILFFGTGFLNARAGRLPLFWASLSAGMPVAIFVILYARFEHFQHSALWSMGAFGLAGVMSIAAGTALGWRRVTPGSSVNAITAVYFAGVTAAVSLGLFIWFEQAWLTALLALQLPAIAHIHDRLRVPFLRYVALLVSAMVIVRLLLNPEIFDYAITTDFPLVNWITYGYGLPALASYVAARWFARSKRDHTVTVLQVASFVFVFVLITFQIRILMHGGSLNAPGYSLLEASFYTAAWLTIVYTVYRRTGEMTDAVTLSCIRLLFWFSVGHFIFIHVLAENPLFTGTALGPSPVFNLLLLAYGVPVLFAALFLRTTQRLPPAVHIAPVNLLVTGFCGALLVYEGLEVRHFFSGSRIALDGSSVSDMELYTYSAVWLVTAMFVMAVGFQARSQSIRFSGLALLTIVVLKVFLYDMSGLTGMLRVTSFMGLGACLVFIGFVYQRYVFAATDRRRV